MAVAVELLNVEVVGIVVPVTVVPNADVEFEVLWVWRGQECDISKFQERPYPVGVPADLDKEPVLVPEDEITAPIENDAVDAKTSEILLKWKVFSWQASQKRG